MSAIETVLDTGDWGTASTQINNNFRALNTDVEKAKNASVKAKGLFGTFELLKETWPSPNKGDWAIVGSTIPGLIYECRVNGVWRNTGQQGGGGDIDLAGYLSSEKITDVTEIL